MRRRLREEWWCCVGLNGGGMEPLQVEVVGRLLVMKGEGNWKEGGKETATGGGFEW